MASKIDNYKKSKRKAHSVQVARATDGSGYVTHTSYIEDHDGSKDMPTSGSNREETGVHKSLHSVHKHMVDCMS